MRFYQRQHAFYCGVDLHARKMHVSVVDEAGTLREQRNLDAGRPGRLLDAEAKGSVRGDQVF